MCKPGWVPPSDISGQRYNAPCALLGGNMWKNSLLNINKSIIVIFNKTFYEEMSRLLRFGFANRHIDTERKEWFLHKCVC